MEENPFVIARYLLTPRRSHDRAQEQFEPFHHLKEIDPGARASMERILRHAIHGDGHQSTFLYVGNELEGNALHTISDVLEVLIKGEQSEGGPLFSQ